MREFTTCRSDCVAFGSKRSSRAPAFAVQGCEFIVRKDDVGGSDVLLEMRHLRSSRDRQDHRTAFQHPGERNLARRSAVLARDRVEKRPRPGEASGPERVPRNEADAALFAMV